MEGLLSKLGEAEFTQYVSSFDIICFTETFLAFQSALDCFADFVQFSRPAVKLSDQGRRSGGVLILVKRTLENFVEIIDLTLDNIVLLKLDRTVFSSDRHVILCGAYVCPPDSPYYKHSQGAITSSISVIEQCLLDCAEKFEQSYFLLCGDFNARTGNLNNSLQEDEEDIHEFIQSELCGHRQSQDKIVNAFGRMLLEMCATCNLTIL
ncbi:endonuclease/exonuclease/phosphatase family protein, partial [Thiolapillus sp.]